MTNQASAIGQIPPPRSATATAFGGLIALAAAIGIGRFVYTPILPPMIEALGLTRSAAGLIASANFLGYLAGALLAASPNLPGPRRVWLLGALVASALTTGAMGLAPTLAPFLVLRFIGGAASALVLIIASALVLERSAEAGRGVLSSLHFAGVGAGIAISAALVAALLHANQSWQVLWLANGALSIVATAAVAWLLPGHHGPARPPARQGGKAIAPGLPRLTIVYGLFGFGYVITATFLVAIVRGTPTIRPLEPAIWVVFGLAAVPSVAVWARIRGTARRPCHVRIGLSDRSRRRVGQCRLADQAWRVPGRDSWWVGRSWGSPHLALCGPARLRPATHAVLWR